MSELSTFIGGASGAKPWVSGATVKQYAYVVSPIDLEIYQRKTATGSGTTDPFYDTTNYRPVSVERLSSISNAWSGGSWTVSGVAGAFAGANSSSAALGAGVRTLMLSVAGKGSLDFCALAKWGTSAISGTFRAEIVVDGRTILDTTFGTPSNNSFAVLNGWAGPVGAALLTTTPAQCPFSKELQVYVTSSAGTGVNVFAFASAIRGIQS